MPTFKSVGTCFFCNAEFTKAGISKHLNSHLTKENKNQNTGLSLHIRICDDPRYGDLYFLNLWVDGAALMSDIDYFLRAIWLECCGHMSKFSDPKQPRSRGMLSAGEFESEIEEIMDSQAGDILEPGMKLMYEYDFGDTTTLQLIVIDEFSAKAPEPILLLSRNEPIALVCEICNSAPAAVICTSCYEPSYFCKKCGAKHAKTCEDFADYAALPVVNSPRMGECGYEGGAIDKKRDGVFMKK